MTKKPAKKPVRSHCPWCGIRIRRTDLACRQHTDLELRRIRQLRLS